MRSVLVPQNRGSVAVEHRAGPAWRRASGGIAVLVGAAACGGAAQQQVAIGPPPAKATYAVLAGALCQDNQCRCRGETPDADVGPPEGPEAERRKRFELRLGPSPHDLWVTIDGKTVLYKSPERAEQCFYLDLSSGAHAVELRASNPDGVSVALAVHELGTRTGSWYDTFAFACGAPGVCSYEELASQKAEYASAARASFDRCGTTKVKGISWDHGKAPDQQHPSELLVRFTLDIYRFPATKVHGDDTCGKGDGRRRADEPAAPPGEAP